jgi:hypothetical protein
MLGKSIGYLHHMPRVIALTMGKSVSSLRLVDGPVWYNERQVPNRGGGGRGTVIPVQSAEIKARLEIKRSCRICVYNS